MAHRHLPAQIFFVFKGITFEKLLLNLLYNNEVITIVMKTPYNGSSVRDLNVYKGRGWGQKSDFYYHEKQYEQKNWLPTKVYKSLKVTFVQQLQVLLLHMAYTKYNVFLSVLPTQYQCKICRKVTFFVWVKGIGNYFLMKYVVIVGNSDFQVRRRTKKCRWRTLFLSRKILFYGISSS